MHRSIRAFTLPELIIVIAVLGILSGIAIVSWGAVVNWSNDRAREADTRQWVNTFELYKSRYAVWPALPADDTTAVAYCLGTFPTDSSKTDTYTNGRCINYAGTTAFNGLVGNYVASSGTSFNSFKTEVEKVGKFPENGGKKNGNFAGPFVYLMRKPAGAGFTVTGVFINFFKNGCPADFTEVSSIVSAGVSSDPANASKYTVLGTTLLAGLPSSTKACGISKSITYGT